ncbi:bifunctional diguanylate cyclase/phosphodiesterase [Elioraea sp.]|uniref:putative bifunctional diguanylate cyclase/phosphodiesterase n=1 Tax=Elioraea sp. TaxID=2185103 RepID=UPI0025BB071D|nr:EAL domain-containing protein [Elioraea sp.]
MPAASVADAASPDVATDAAAAGTGTPPRLLATLRGRIILAFLAVGLLTAGLGAFSLAAIDHAGRLVVATYDTALMSISSARAAAGSFTALKALEARKRATTGMLDHAADRFARLVDATRGSLVVAAERAQGKGSQGEGARAAAAAAHAVEAWIALAATPPRQDEDAFARWRSLDAAAAAAEEALAVLVSLTAGDGVLHRRRAVDAVADIGKATAVATAVALVLGLVVAVVLSRRIIGPVAAASAAARGIAGGRLDTPIPRADGDELGALLGAMTVMRDTIRRMVEREEADRRSARSRVGSTIGTAQDGFVLVDGAGRITAANTPMAAFYPEAVALLAAGTPATALAAAIGGGVLASDEVMETRLRDGRWLRISRSPTQEGGFIATFTDITVLKRNEAALSQTALRFDAALNNMSQGLCMFDRENVLLVVNRRFCEIYRVDPAKVVPGITFRQMMGFSIAAGNHARTDADALVARRLAFIARREAATAFQELADGRVIAISHEPMRDGGWVVTYEDITERRRAEAQITHMARHDGLTGLPNRAQFRERIDTAIAAGRPFAVFSIDLDDFRAVNEGFGHPAGDEVLREAAARLLSTVPEGCTVARLGADEFAVIQSGIAGADDAAALAARLSAALAAPWRISTGDAAIGGSIGIAIGPGDGAAGSAAESEGADTLVTQADLARELGRREGRGAVRFFEPGMDARQQKRRLLEADLRQALGNGEFALHYQPLVEIATGRVTGFEALLRWRHPRRGLVSPGDFIPLAEQLELIAPIGAWVLGQACMDAAAFPGGQNVSVNVSPLQFRRPGLVEATAEALARSGLPPGRLELEVTESVLLDDSEATREVLHRLRDLGLRIAMDDFGTGYSSLSTLRSFPFDKIKIDQTFVRDLASSAEARSIVSAIVGLGGALGMRTTAEGVETDGQLAALAAEGCVEAQGYLFSKPRPVEELPALLRRLGAREDGQPQPRLPRDQPTEDQPAEDQPTKDLPTKDQAAA